MSARELVRVTLAVLTLMNINPKLEAGLTLLSVESSKSSVESSKSAVESSKSSVESSISSANDSYHGLAEKLSSLGVDLERSRCEAEQGSSILEIEMLIHEQAQLDRALDEVEQSLSLPKGRCENFRGCIERIRRSFGEERIGLYLRVRVAPEGEWSLEKLHIALGRVDLDDFGKEKYSLEISEDLANSLLNGYLEEELDLDECPIPFPVEAGQLKAQGGLYIANAEIAFRRGEILLKSQAKAELEFKGAMEGFSAGAMVKDLRSRIDLQRREMPLQERKRLREIDALPPEAFDLELMRELKSLKSKHQARLKMQGRFKGEFEMELKDFVELGSFETPVRRAIHQALRENFKKLEKALAGPELARYVAIEEELELSELQLEDEGEFRFSIDEFEVDLSETLRRYLPIGSPLSLERLEIRHASLYIGLELR